MDDKDPKNKEAFLAFKANPLQKLDQQICAFCNDGSLYKKSVLISYWLETYTRFLKQELTYKPNFQPSYKRGSIIEVDFAYKIGSEFGGLHYAVVLDNEDKKTHQF